ncbi:GNAT family N-acetyltransferase [Cellulosimicrobium sp. PMB13]|uniref:GNAT family N-acetyltransferase n=1 Tax=Cellulosimicrobium sp. PMB13 TaxID=3120158 RepID=UPI003F4B54FD
MSGATPAWAPWRPTRHEVAELEAEHRARVRALDGLVAVPDLLGTGPDAEPVLAVRLADGSRAVGVATRSDVDARSTAATFRALRERRLRARAAGPDVPGAVAALVGTWFAEVRTDHAPGRLAPASEPQDAGSVAAPSDEGLALLWPSRDVEAVAALAASGLRPVAHLAARRDARPGGSSADLPTGVVLRDAVPADVEAVVEHQLAELALDALVGSARVREDARATLAPQVAAAVARPDTTVLVAERVGPDASVLGVVAVEPPRLSGLVAGAVTRSPAAYVVLLHVDDALRGRGLGSALVEGALARVRDASGAGTTVLLHHGVLNPLSAPFWARHGFRPVLTTWELPVGATT